MRSYRWGILSSLLAVALSACSGGNGGGGGGGNGGGGGGRDTTHGAEDPGVPVSRHGSNEVVAAVGRQGGTLELSNGARLEIAQGALSSATEVTFAIGAETLGIRVEEDRRPIGPVLQISPEMATSSGRLTLSIPFQGVPSGFSSEDLAIAMEVVDEQQRSFGMDGIVTRWEFLPARVSGERLAAELSEVTGLRLQFVASR
jgi:hypothetical protein